MIELSNKKVKYSILAALFGCVLFFLFLHFLVLPAIGSWKDDSAKTMELGKKLSAMRQVVQSGTQVQKQIEAARALLEMTGTNIPLPVLGNYLLEMEKYIRDCADNVGVKITSIVDNDILGISPDNKFKVYRIRVQTRSGYNDFVALVSGIHSGNPLVSISGLNIVAREDEPAVHEINFVVDWLVWAEPAKRPVFLMEESK